MSELRGYKCPNCGAAVPFDPNTQKLVCEHCGSEYETDALDSYNRLIQESREDSLDWGELNMEQLAGEGMQSFVCPSCGGSVTADASTGATCCPYCGNPLIAPKAFAGMLLPDLVIPFKLDKKAAQERFEQFLRNKKALPNDFKPQRVLEKIQGLYVPYWLFDCDAQASARYLATRTHSHREGDYRVLITDHFYVYRDGEISFNKVPVDASQKLDDELLQSLEPFDYQQAVSFNTAYLSGFLADKYDEEPDNAVLKANERIRNSMLMALGSKVIEYDSVVLDGSWLQLNQAKRSYALLPIYIYSAVYRGKNYRFAMNGQTGRIVGNLPADNKKLFITFGKYFSLGFVVLFVVSFLLLGGWL